MSAVEIAQSAKESFDASQLLDAGERHKALLALKEALTTHKQAILDANREDIEVGLFARLSKLTGAE